MPSTQNDALEYVEKSDTHDGDKTYWKNLEPDRFRPSFKPLEPLASDFRQTPYGKIAGVHARLYYKTQHEKKTLLVAIPGGPEARRADRDENFAAQGSFDLRSQHLTETDSIGSRHRLPHFDVPPVEKNKTMSPKRYDELAKAFGIFCRSDLAKDYEECKLVGASAGCYDAIILARLAAKWDPPFPFTAVVAVVPVTTWVLDLEQVSGQQHAPGLGYDRMYKFCETATWGPIDAFDPSCPQHLMDLWEASIKRLPNMLFITAKHDVLYAPRLEFAKRVQKENQNAITVVVANGPHQVKDSEVFAANKPVTACIKEYLQSGKIDLFGSDLLELVPSPK